MNFLAVKTTRLFEEISRQIGGQIQSGALAAGEKLPNERELIEHNTVVQEPFLVGAVGSFTSIGVGRGFLEHARERLE